MRLHHRFWNRTIVRFILSSSSSSSSSRSLSLPIPFPSDHRKFLLHPTSPIFRGFRGGDGNWSRKSRGDGEEEGTVVSNKITEPTRLAALFTYDQNLLVSDLVDQLVSAAKGRKPVVGILESNLCFFKECTRDEVLELLRRLDQWPKIAIQVLNWKRELEGLGISVYMEEYTKGLMIAGRLKKLDLALEYFNEACTRNKKSISTYNGLMTAYMCNGLNHKALEVFEELNRDGQCKPNIITYNIVLSIYGRLVLIDQMEAIYKKILYSNLTPNLRTYNTVIAGYISAWMWDDMEKIFARMRYGQVKPEISTRLLMLRGYANAGRLRQMEDMYESVKDWVDTREVNLVTAMICAYCKNIDVDRVKKVERLLNLLPKDHYRSWLDVLLIRMCADEDNMERMENYICRAIEKKTVVVVAPVMRSIISCYFRCNALEKLNTFVKQAEAAGWRLCRSLYHCKMVMLAAQNCFDEMENVLTEMESNNFMPSKKTFWILYKAYMRCDYRAAQRIMTTMCKAGYGIPSDGPS